MGVYQQRNVYYQYAENSKETWRQIGTRRYGASVHFGVVVVELINCKCGGIVRNQIW